MSPDAFGEVIVNIPVDWVFIVCSALLASFDVLRNGAGRVCALALALPAALLLNATFPQAIFLGGLIDEDAMTPLIGGLIFLIFTVALYFLLRRMDASYGGEYGQPIQALLGGCAVTIILVVVWLGVPHLGSLWQFGDSVPLIFGPQYAFWWLIGSYATLAFIRD